MSHPILVEHNFLPGRFMWLWSKYVREVNLARHCQACLRGPYSKRLSKHNPHLEHPGCILLDEEPEGAFGAIYICGVSSRGYKQKRNYEHNVHLALRPDPGSKGEWQFEEWRVRYENAAILRIPKMNELSSRFLDLPDEYTTCRIFRFAAGNKDIFGKR